MSISDLTKVAVESAIAEYDSVGHDAFLSEHGFSEARRYWVVHAGKRYPSKAIVGAAHKYVAGSIGPLEPKAFSGGNATVARKLRQLGFEVLAPERNPAWSRDELILALDLYLSNSANPPGKESAAVAELSALLNKLHRLNGGASTDTLRNLNGVYLKMMNLRALDPEFIAQGKIGMTSGGKLEKVIWDEYQGKRNELAADAAAIRKAISTADGGALAILPQSDPYEAEEGGVILRLHRSYERDRRLVAEKKKQAKDAGKLACEVCDFDFEIRYGALGADFIEVHHIKPIHATRPGAKTNLEDLALLCSNCHRMAHRKRSPLSLADLRQALRTH